jgi:hypothetical protein
MRVADWTAKVLLHRRALHAMAAVAFYLRSPLSLPAYRRNTLSKRPICSVTILIACSLFRGLAIGAPASIAASCRIASARYRRVSANRSIGSMLVLRCFASTKLASIWTRLLGVNPNSIFASGPVSRRNFVLAFWWSASHNSPMPASAPKARFEPIRLKSGKGWYVRVTPPHGRETQIGGFARKAEAVAWVEHESAEWLKTYEGGKYA